MDKSKTTKTKTATKPKATKADKLATKPNGTLFEKSQTKVNLARAFAGECQDGARYQFLAQQAMEENYPYLQSILKTLAKNEMAHAKTFYQLISQNCKDSQHNIKITGGYPFECGTLKQSILDSIQTELSQSENVYPSFAKVARDEGYPEIATKFELVAGIEDTHHKLLTEILDKMKANKLYKSTTAVKWKCNNCGYEHVGKACWTTCPSCGMSQGMAQFNVELK